MNGGRAGAIPAPTRSFLRPPGHSCAHPVIPAPTRSFLRPPGHSCAHPVIPAPTRSFLRPPGHSCAHPVIPAPTRSFLRPPGHSCAHPVIPAEAGIQELCAPDGLSTKTIPESRPRIKYVTRVCNGRLVDVFTRILTFPHQGGRDSDRNTYPCQLSGTGRRSVAYGVTFFRRYDGIGLALATPTLNGYAPVPGVAPLRYSC